MAKKKRLLDKNGNGILHNHKEFNDGIEEAARLLEGQGKNGYASQVRELKR